VSASTTPPETPRPSPQPSAVSDAGSSGLLAALDDRLNPILVREVRQALRGRYFRITFLFTLAAATLIGLLVLSNAPDAREPDVVGVWFFIANFACLAGAVLFFVPFSGFTSMGAEWEENTYDLLAISNLRPRQIVMGKLLASLVMAALFFSAFGPFLVFSFVMRGVDLASTAVVLAGTMILSVVLTLFALCLSSLARIRFARIALMAALAVTLVYAAIGSGVFGAFLVSNPHVLQQDPEFTITSRVFLTAAALVGGLFFVVACSRLAHPEENRSTGLRIFTALFPLAGLPWMVWVYREVGHDADVVRFAVMQMLLLILMPLIFIVTEEERLGRRVRLSVPRNRALALLAAPFLPGGGRGILLAVLLIALTVAGALLTLALDPPVGGSWLPLGGPAAARTGASAKDVAFLGTTGLYAFLYLALPSGLFAAKLVTERGRALVRILIPLGFLLALVLPSVAGLFLGRGDLMGIAHGGNPLWVLWELESGGLDDVRVTLWVVVGLALVAATLNLPRIVRGLREVLAESAERCRREVCAAPPPGPSPPETSDALPLA